MANPNLIGGGRLTRGEMSENSSRRFQKSTMPRGALLRRFWRYLGRNQALILLAMLLSVSSSLLALYGPKLSGEAINAITYFIDDAILVGVSRVRILHGTGSGILRQLIRQYLATIPNVTHFRDEHVQFGGAGITVVDLD